MRGEFVGIDELTHLHVHPKGGSAVLTAYNLSETPVTRSVRIPVGDYAIDAAAVRVSGAKAHVEGKDLVVDLEIGPLSPVVVEIGVAK